MRVDILESEYMRTIENRRGSFTPSKLSTFGSFLFVSKMSTKCLLLLPYLEIRKRSLKDYLKEVKVEKGIHTHFGASRFKKISTANC